MEFEDKTITCADCAAEFIHSAADQARYAERGLEHEPKRCAACRAKRRNRQPGRGGPRGSGGGHRSARPSFPAVCHTCGKETTVPFQPTEGRPVYCRECYQDANADKTD